MKNLSLFACILVFVCIACDSDRPTNEVGMSEPETSMDLPSRNTQQLINLNSGEKWVVDSEMMVYIRAMEKGIQAYSMDKETERLSDSLQSNIGSLISSCTMTGQAHDELHKWLLPFMATADSLKEKKGKNTIEELNHALKRFHVYFK